MVLFLLQSVWTPEFKLKVRLPHGGQICILFKDKALLFISHVHARDGLDMKKSVQVLYDVYYRPDSAERSKLLRNSRLSTTHTSKWTSSSF